MKRIILTSLALLLALLISAKEKEQPNVLLITVDDMNDWVGAFGGHPQAITPNIDKFAEKSVIFTRAYCSAPLCNPSRASMLTGYRPSTTGVYGNEENFRTQEGFENTITLPQYFHQYGYSTTAGGKIFHSPRGKGETPKPHSDPGSFEKERKGGLGTHFPAKEDRFQHGIELGKKGGHMRKAFDWGPSPDGKLKTHDWQNADYCVKELQQQHDKPFFLACGIFRPHLPWYAPQEYFDMYPLEDIVVPEVMEGDLDDVGPIGKKMANQATHSEVLRNDLWQSAVRGYLASLTFADECVGHVLDALESSEYKENTIVVIMGDHGWHLGEKEHWSKQTLWERAAKTPLIIYDPRTKASGECTGVVSLLDVYPTLVDMCNLPANAENEGVSLKKLVKNPNTKWDGTALTTKQEGNHSIRKGQYRYTVYKDGFEELYDHSNDPNEWTNIAKENESILVDFRKELKEILK